MKTEQADLGFGLFFVKNEQKYRNLKVFFEKSLYEFSERRIK